MLSHSPTENSHGKGKRDSKQLKRLTRRTVAELKRSTQEGKKYNLFSVQKTGGIRGNLKKEAERRGKTGLSAHREKR